MATLWPFFVEALGQALETVRLARVGAIDNGKRSKIDEKIVADEQKKDFDLSRSRRFLYRTRYFTDSGIIGTKAFVKITYERVKERFQAKRDKVPKPIAGLTGIYSLKRLNE